jgi:hypothetical protein
VGVTAYADPCPLSLTVITTVICCPTVNGPPGTLMAVTVRFACA